MKNVSEAKFTGVIAFKNGQAALQMQLLVNSIIDKSVNIFSSNRTFQPSQLLTDLEKMVDLSQNFVDYAFNEENAQIERKILQEMNSLVERLGVTIRQFNGTSWTLSQSQSIAENMRDVFQRLEKLTEKNEEDHVRKALKQIDTAKSCQSSLANGTDYDPSNWSILLKNYTTMQNILFGIMENRAAVTKEESRKNEILDLKRRMTTLSDSIPVMCEQARLNNFPQELINKIMNAERNLRNLTEQFEEILKFGIECFSSFKHTPIEPEKFGEQLDDLVNAIQSGDTSGFMSAARNLTSEVGNIKNRELLENETRELNQQTKELLINAREVLKDNDKENAKKKMNELAATLKKNVENLALQEKQMMNSKKKLSQQATGLGMAMQNMGQVLTTITGNDMVSNSPLLKKRQDKDFDDIENSLEKLEFSKEAPQHTTPVRTTTTTTTTVTTKSSNDDLDDLERELNEIDNTPVRRSGEQRKPTIIKQPSFISNQQSFSIPKTQYTESSGLNDLDDLERDLDNLEGSNYISRNSSFTSEVGGGDLDELEELERELEDL